MKAIPFASVFFGVVVTAGCATPPMAPPDALTDYRPVSQFGNVSVNEEDQKDITKVCAVKAPIDDAEKPELAVKRALQKTHIRSCEYAFYSDRVKDFKAYTDESTLGFAAVTAVGALTDSHSDFVKSMAGLTGLSGGLRIYANPTVQITTYIKAAKATQCLGGTLLKLNRVMESNSKLLTNTKDYEDSIEDVRSALNNIKYNPEMQKAMLELAPGPQVLNVINQAADPDADAESKRAALAFIKDIESVTDENLRTIYARIVATLNAQAFNVESATQPIKATHGGQKGGNSGETIAKTMTESSAYKVLVAASSSNPYESYAATLRSLSTSQATDNEVPYPELIRLNGEFVKCMTTYAAN